MSVMKLPIEGQVIIKVTGLEKGSDQVEFLCMPHGEYLMYHEQQCCESVTLEDVCGDPADLEDAYVISAEVRSAPGNGHCNYPSPDPDEYEWGWDEWMSSDHATWTFYVIQTNKGCVTIRWYGHSNGYYSEAVTFEKVSSEEWRP